jgi:UDPglucose 6-dehydrogenase
VTFKAGSEDLRESPAIDIINLLRNEGARVRVYDPSLELEQAKGFADQVCTSALEAATGADCVAILTDWPEFAEMDYKELYGVMNRKVIYDGRIQLQRETVESAHFEYHGIGRPVHLQPAALGAK